MENEREKIAQLVAEMVRDPKVQRLELDLSVVPPTLRYRVQLERPAEFIVINLQQELEDDDEVQVS